MSGLTSAEIQRLQHVYQRAHIDFRSLPAESQLIWYLGENGAALPPDPRDEGRSYWGMPAGDALAGLGWSRAKFDSVATAFHYPVGRELYASVGIWDEMAVMNLANEKVRSFTRIFGVC